MSLVKDLGFRTWGLGLGLRGSGFGLRGLGSGLRGLGLGFRGLGALGLSFRPLKCSMHFEDSSLNGGRQDPLSAYALARYIVHKKDYSILGSILGAPYFGKLPYCTAGTCRNSSFYVKILCSRACAHLHF